jgi:hypothetical protein
VTTVTANCVESPVDSAVSRVACRQ